MSPISSEYCQNVFRIVIPFSTAKIVLFSRLSKQIRKKNAKKFGYVKKKQYLCTRFSPLQNHTL